MGRGVKSPQNLKITGFDTANSHITIEYRIARVGMVECFHDGLIREIMECHVAITQMVPMECSVIGGISLKKRCPPREDELGGISCHFSCDTKGKSGGIDPLMGGEMGRILGFKGGGNEVIVTP